MQKPTAEPTTPDLDNVCSVDIEVGECSGSFMRYGFDVKAGECKQFQYGGCGGNGNNFATMAECRRKCLATKQTEGIRKQGGRQLFVLEEGPSASLSHRQHAQARAHGSSSRLERMRGGGFDASGRCNSYVALLDTGLPLGSLIIYLPFFLGFALFGLILVLSLVIQGLEKKKGGPGKKN